MQQLRCIGRESGLEVVLLSIATVILVGLRVEAELLVVLLECGKVVAGLGELTLLHSLSDEPVDEGALVVHEVELVVDARKDLGDGGGVGQHADGTRHLGHLATIGHGGRLVVDAALEAGRAPVDELDGALVLDVADGGRHVLGNDVAAVHQAARHVLAVARVALGHHVLRLEDAVGDLGHEVGLVVGLLGREHRGVGAQHKVNARERHQVGLELVDVDVERALEAQRGRERRDHLRNQAVEVLVRRLLNVERAVANVVDGLVVENERHVGVLEQRVRREHGVVGLDDRGRHLRRRVQREVELALLGVVGREALEQQRAEARAGATADRVEDQEALEALALVGQASDAVEAEVDHLLADRVVAASIVVGRVLLAGDELVRVVQLAVVAGAHLVDHSGLEVDHDAARNELARAGLVEEGAERLVLAGLVGRETAIGLDAVLEAVELPAGVTDLDTALAEVDRDDFSHSEREEEGRGGGGERVRGLPVKARGRGGGGWRGDESELSDMFDKVLICAGRRGQSSSSTADETLPNGPSKTLLPNEQTNGSNSGKARGKKQGKKKVVDLRTLLILCAQAITSNDNVTAKELIKQIRQHSSPYGDGSQRLAHYFVDALEARLAGTGTQIYTSLIAKRTSAADMLKAYQVYISVCPFVKVPIIFANNYISKAAEKATKLHIIDFGIFYGFHWPALIHRLANRPGGPPKLRITGIEFPQPGFRPAEAVQETGRRLVKYCERYNVPFEYHAIAQKWETIRTEDLKINSDEVIAVNCLCRFRNLLDETVVLNSPRDTVLNLIRKINPDVFVHSVVNGSYNAPFFVTRFREALFHFSALFDMCETNVSHEDNMRSMLEQKFYGREIMNIIACEGTERVERPESYKQWQVRNMRAGFVQLPLNPELMKRVKERVKARYHSDFMVDVDGRWMLQGWKGRIIYASSAWIPA